MKILVVNDDGMRAAQLPGLIRWCRQFGEVTAVVPMVEQSGKSHGIELHRDFLARKERIAPDVEVWAVDSTPADCVRFGVLYLKQDYDLVISGVNKGFNVGVDVMYSGTVGAVYEAANLGLPAIAFSTHPVTYDQFLPQMDEVWAFIQEHKLLEQHPLWNVNIPTPALGHRITRQGGVFFTDDFIPQGEDLYRPTGRIAYTPHEGPDMDTDAVMEHYYSYMPLDHVRTEMTVFESFKHLNK